MTVTKSKLIVSLAILGSVFCFYLALEHQVMEKKVEEATSSTGTLDLFAALGIEYLDTTLINSELAEGFDVRTTEKYLQEPEFYEEMVALYEDEIEKGTLVPLSIRWISEEVGYGAFAEKDLQEGEFIGVYTGILQDDSLSESWDYAWEYPAKTSDLEHHFLIDGALKGNELRFVNDGVDPNCIVKYVVGKNNCWNVCYVALKEIKTGEQLLISYGESYWKSRDYKFLDHADQKQVSMN